MHLPLTISLQPTESALGLEVLPGVRIQCRQFVELADSRGLGMVKFYGKIPSFHIPYGFYRNFFSLCQNNFASIFAKTEF